MKRKKKQPETFREYVKRVCLQLQYLFYCNLYQLHFTWAEDTLEPSGDESSGSSVAMEVKIDEKYLHITITLYKTAYQMWLDDELGPALVHEFCHTVTDPLYRYLQPQIPHSMTPMAKLLWERETEIMARLLCAVGDGAVNRVVGTKNGQVKTKN